VEETRPGQYLPIEEDGRGSYVMNSRDLCLVEHLPQLVQAGVDSLKIEGRMKSRYYVAAVTRVYRAALDSYLADPGGYRFEPRWQEELEKVSHRPYDSDVLAGGSQSRVHHDDSRYRRSHDFVGVVVALAAEGRGTVQARNRFFPGETLEVIGPEMRQEQFSATGLTGADGRALPVAQPNDLLAMDLPAGTQPGDLLRREKTD
jgi:putative protease